MSGQLLKGAKGVRCFWASASRMSMHCRGKNWVVVGSREEGKYRQLFQVVCCGGASGTRGLFYVWYGALVVLVQCRGRLTTLERGKAA